MRETTAYEVFIEEELQGTRLDAVLSFLVEDISRSGLQKLIAKGNVTVNDKVETVKKAKVKKGDRIGILIPEPKPLDIVPQDIPLDIVYEDSDIMVVDKPYGMVVHPAAGNESGTLVNAILYHCDTLSGINGVIRPGIVHRIDKDTTGLLMIAKNDHAHQALAKQLAEHTITRRYHAIVYHNFGVEEGSIDQPIGRDPKNRLKQAVTTLNGKKAVTHYRVLERFTGFSYVEVRLETGRTHQIRVHMAYIQHPLLGDGVYGPKKSPLAAKRQMLHAKVLGFCHPTTGKYMEFNSELPEDFKRILNELENRRKK